MLRVPHVVLVDTGAVRAEYGDAGLGPVFDFLRHQVPEHGWRSGQRRGSSTSSPPKLVPRSKSLRADVDGCVSAVLATCAIA